LCPLKTKLKIFLESILRIKPAVLAGALLLSARLSAGAAGGYLIDSWDVEKGLPDNFVTSVVQTPDGYLWIGTYNGLSRFDGSRFVTYKPEDTPALGHPRIVKLFLDAQGTLWINTYDGSLTSWRNGVFTREWSGKKKGVSEAWLVAGNSRELAFAFRSGLLIRRSLAPGASNAWSVLEPPGQPPGAFYCEDHTGALWCSTLDGKLWRIINDQFELLPSGGGLRGQDVHWLAADLAGRIWVGTEKEMALWNGSRFQDMSPAGEPELDVASLFFTGDGGILVAANGRLRKYLNRRWVAELKTEPDLMQEQQLQPVSYEDHEGGLWQVSRGLGIFHIRPDGVSEQITVTNGLPGDHTTCWLEDQEDNIWVGLGNGGLARLRKQHFEVIGMPDGRPATPAKSVCEDQTGALWIGTYGGGLIRQQQGRLTHFPIPTQNPGDFVFSIFPDSGGQLWISAGMEDTFIFQDGRLKPAPVAVHGVKSILVDRQRRTWLGRKDGVDCWADGKLREWNSHNGSIAKPVRALAEDRQGVIWIGADDGNIYRFDGGGFQAFPLPEVPPHQAIWSLLADADGTLWVGTSDAGLLHFEAGHFTRFTSKDGLPDDMICQILDDQHGNLWIGSHAGICRVSKTSLHAFASGKAAAIACSVYGRSDGLPTLQCSDMYQPSAWRGHDGKLWFATAKGVVGVQPDEVPVNSRPPPVVIEEFLVDGHTQARPDEFETNTAGFKVSPGRQNFEFHFTALSLTDADKIHFRYQLEGFDPGWIEAGTRRWVQYNYLKPGTYRFRVIACNNDGLWNETGASVNVHILPHFWETWWFPTLLGLALVTIVAGLARYISHRGLRRELVRLAHQRDIEQDRSRIARDIHDNIGSGLTRINLLNELLLGDPAGQLPHRIAQITEVTCELMRAMDEIVWAVNPKNDTLDSLMSYLCDFADEYLRTAKIRLRIHMPASLPAWHLTSEVRHNLFLAVKEVLNNIVKHSHASEVFFNLKLEAGSATITIRDNGRGFQLDSVPLELPVGLPRTNRNGLDNLQKRASSIGGWCFVQSEPGTGTIIELTVPGPKNKRTPATKLTQNNSALN
jgi:ligand-binding sensor domain-containing protein/signal transduction histidine kinase